MRRKILHTISGAASALSFFLLLGVVGGMEHGLIDFGIGVLYLVVLTLSFAIFAKLSGAMESKEGERNHAESNDWKEYRAGHAGGKKGRAV